MQTNLNLFIENIYSSITFDFFIKLVVVYFFILWIAILLWVIKDITNRTDNVFLQVVSILIILFLTPFWVFIYLLIRPSKTIFEKYYEEIEENIDIFKEIIEERIKVKEEKSKKKKKNKE